MNTSPFRIEISQDVLDDLKARLARTRFPDALPGVDWEYGTNLDYLKELVAYWQSEFDWRAQEEFLNSFAHFRTEVSGFGLHFIHERGRGDKPIPLLLTHGWPDSFVRMVKLIPLLTDPERYGGKAEDAFDVVVPSIPGYGFSDKPHETGFGSERIADLFVELMTGNLGYSQFFAHGGDWGSSITEQMARRHPGSLLGIHLTDVPYGHLFSVSKDELSAAEQKYLQAGQKWQEEEGAYAAIQSTKPQTLAYGLNDSPAGLAAWIIEKFRTWSDCEGDVERRFSKDELLTNITLYWATETVNSAARLYYEAQHASSQTAQQEQRVEVPTGVAIFPKDLVPAPREFGERFFNVQRWEEMPSGGHFAALEEPQLLAEEIRAFCRPLRR